jgi:hypothetical protein
MTVVHAIHATSLGIAVLLCLSGAGCQTIAPGVDLLAGLDGSPPVEAVSENVDLAAQYTVEYHREDQPAQGARFPLQEGMCVQDALEQSGALRKLTRMKIHVYRSLPQSGALHRMEIPFDRSNRRVPPESDYALHPGDRVVIAKDDSSAIDDMLNSVLGPLGVSMN